MQIYGNIPSFKGRASSVKDAQDICRKVRNSFPYVAYSKAALNNPEIVENNPKLLDYILKKNNQIKEYREDRKYIKNSLNFYKEILYSTEHAKIAPCYELSALTEMILRLNGIKNCAKASLVTNKGQKLNHCVTCVFPEKTTNPNKVIVIDSFLQDADFLPNMITKYKNQYKKFFKQPKKGEKIELEVRNPIPLNIKAKEYLSTKYPQLLFKHSLFHNKKN